MKGTITPNLWFDTQAEEAAAFYCSVFENSRVVTVTHYTEAGPREAGMVLTVEFELNGQRFVAINGGPEFTFSEAISFQVFCEDQAEVDHFWNGLLEGGGEESQCGWLKDRFGLSWQIVPKLFYELMGDPDPAKVQRVMTEMFTMKKLDCAALQRAADAG
jgi:predicted 3-demethylubiquinone-9 3-methyltransferase (glyoxalase superfamily)